MGSVLTEEGDDELVRRVGAGEAAALEELLRRHQRSVLATAYRFLGDAHAAEDVAQDVFFRVYRAAGSYAARGRFRPWLHRIVWNLCANARRPARPGGLERWEEVAGSAPGPGHRAEQAEQRQAVRAAIEQLPPGQRMALILHRFEGLPQAEIAQAMGLSIAAVEARLHRARETLRRTLAPLARALRE
jgi:RNA polymerase sigma-70 factor (ECF subfamily)